MKTKIIVIIMLATTTMYITGCTESYSGSGSGNHVYHHSQPSTSNALQAIGELSYQAIGRRNGVTPQKYNNNMRGLGALGTLMDFSNR